jgi:hypothetical protein
MSFVNTALSKGCGKPSKIKGRNFWRIWGLGRERTRAVFAGAESAVRSGKVAMIAKIANPRCPIPRGSVEYVDFSLDGE